MKRKILYILLLIILIGDLSYSFLQYYSTPLDGDIAGGVVPANDVQKIFDDPLGFNSILTGKKHPNPNRFFAHLFFIDYFQKTPIFLQNFVSPIESIYISAACIKLLVQLIIIFVLSFLISKSKSIFNFDFLVASLLIIPFFQAFGYTSFRIIDIATTYVFFYSLPIAFLMIYLLIFQRVTIDKSQNILSKIILSLLTIILPFSGPLISPIILICFGLLMSYYYLNYKKYDGSKKLVEIFSFIKQIPKNILILSIPIAFISLYALWLGNYNSTYQAESIPIIRRYMNLPLGLYYLFSQKIAFPIFFLFMAVNIFLIKKYFYQIEGEKIINALKWFGIFALAYILLLPLGGYRPYRPYIIRFDTFLPITIGLLYFYGASTLYLLKRIKKQKYIYIFSAITMFLIFTNADLEKLNANQCEKHSLELIANSKDKIVKLNTKCNILSWTIITNPEETKLNSKLLKMWNITDDEKLYYTDN